MSLFFYLFTFAINLWQQKVVTADVTAVFVNSMVFFSDEDKILIKHIDTFRIHSYTRRGIKMVHLKCNLFAFSSMCAEYLQKI